MVITQRNVMVIWKKLAQGFNSLGDGGSGSVSMDSSASMNLDPIIPCASTVPVGIPRMISHISKRGHEFDAYVGKADTSVEKLDFSVGKASVVALKPTLLSSNEEFFGTFCIVEEMHDTQDPTITISANP